MADEIEKRDFFISFTSVDFAYAEAIDEALRAAGFTTFFHPRDIQLGGNIPVWMDNALMNSRQMLALYSPEYVADSAVYSKAERYAQFWQDSVGAEFKLIPVELKATTFTPLMSVNKRFSVTGKSPKEAAAALVAALKKPGEVEEREVIQSVEPLPKIFNVFYRHNPNFTGRFEAMESLQKSLRDGNAALTALAGIGGVGKTTLAAEYCHRFGGRYGGVWWVRAEQEPVMLADLATLGGRIGIAATGNVEADARVALENIASRPEPWLMVYDNVPNADAVRKWLPAGAVRCIITSRFSGFDDVATVTTLEQWSNEVTADYLLARAKRTDKNGALRLAHTLGGLPLAAEQAAVFLKDRKGISFDDYAKEIGRLIKEEKPAGSKGDYPDSVYAAFVKSLDAVNAMRAGKAALNLLRLCAFLSPDGVDVGLLTVEWGHEILPAEFARAIADKFTREDALAALASLSLLRQEIGPAGPILIFHRLLLEVVRDRMGADARARWGTAAVKLASSSFPNKPDTDPSTWPLCIRLMPHVAPLDAYAPRSDLAGKALDFLFNQASLYLGARGDHGGALALADKSVKLARLTEKVDPLGLATSLNNRASRYVELGRLAEAEDDYKEVLKIGDKHLPDGDSRRAIWISNLAALQVARRRFAEAEPLFQQAAEITRSAHGVDSAEYGTALGNLDALYDDWAEISRSIEKRRIAERFSTQALTVTSAARGLRHPQTATRHYNLAVLKARLSDFLGAEAEMEQALAIMLSLDLTEHPATRQTTNDLAALWQHSKQTDKATRLQAGDFSDLLPVIARVESEHRAWVAEDPEHRHFGPPSPFANLPKK